jgi:hypothetical protein
VHGHQLKRLKTDRIDRSAAAIPVRGARATSSERRADGSAGVETRLASIFECLGLVDMPGHVRYQLVHRTASAVLAARQFFAQSAVMLVHSFSLADRWFEDFVAFAQLLKASPRIGEARACGAMRADTAVSRLVQGRPAVSLRERMTS